MARLEPLERKRGVGKLLRQDLAVRDFLGQLRFDAGLPLGGLLSQRALLCRRAPLDIEQCRLGSCQTLFELFLGRRGLAELVSG